MAEFRLNIACDNAAFNYDDTNPEDDGDLRMELAAILVEIAGAIQREGLSGYPEKIRDSNGNTVGTMFFKGE